MPMLTRPSRGWERRCLLCAVRTTERTNLQPRFLSYIIFRFKGRGRSIRHISHKRTEGLASSIFYSVNWTWLVSSLSHAAFPSFHQVESSGVVVTVGSAGWAQSPWFEPQTLWWAVQFANHFTTVPPYYILDLLPSMCDLVLSSLGFFLSLPRRAAIIDTWQSSLTQLSKYIQQRQGHRTERDWG